METTTAIGLFEKGLSKSEIKNIAIGCVEAVFEEGNPLRIAEAMSAMETFVKEVKGNPKFIEYVREEVEKTGKNFTSNSGAKIELAEVGTKYDFEHCGDVEWERMDAEMKGLKERIKERESFLKTVKASGLTVVNEETGEVSTVYPPSKTSNSSFKVTLS